MTLIKMKIADAQYPQLKRKMIELGLPVIGIPIREMQARLKQKIGSDEAEFEPMPEPKAKQSDAPVTPKADAKPEPKAKPEKEKKPAKTKKEPKPKKEQKPKKEPKPKKEKKPRKAPTKGLAKGEIKEKVLALHKEKKSITEIEEATGFIRNTIWTILKREENRKEAKRAEKEKAQKKAERDAEKEAVK